MNFLLNIPDKSVGFEGNVKLTKGPATKQLTIEIETLQPRIPNQQVRINYNIYLCIPCEYLSFFQGDPLSSQFLIALLDFLGILTSIIILEALHQ